MDKVLILYLQLGQHGIFLIWLAIGIWITLIFVLYHSKNENIEKSKHNTKKSKTKHQNKSITKYYIGLGFASLIFIIGISSYAGQQSTYYSNSWDSTVHRKREQEWQQFVMLNINIQTELLKAIVNNQNFKKLSIAEQNQLLNQYRTHQYNAQTQANELENQF